MKLSGACSSCEGLSRALPSVREQPSALRAKAGTAITRSNAELTVYTAEGDKVTLSSSASSESGPSRYGVRGQGGSQYSSDRSSLSVSVDGDLNAEEIADIQELANILTSAGNQALAGDRQGAEASVAEQFDDLESIAKFEYSYSASTEYSSARPSRNGRNAAPAFEPPTIESEETKPALVESKAPAKNPVVEAVAIPSGLAVAKPQEKPLEEEDPLAPQEEILATEPTAKDNKILTAETPADTEIVTAAPITDPVEVKLPPDALKPGDSIPAIQPFSYSAQAVNNATQSNTQFSYNARVAYSVQASYNAHASYAYQASYSSEFSYSSQFAYNG